MRTKLALALLLLVLVSSFLAVAARAADPAADSPLPIRRVVLYKHGVGYFERSGTVPGGQVLHLYFKREQMNDLLKTLIAVDADGGPVGSITYDSSKTASQVLRDYTFDLHGEVGLPRLLQQLQGARIEATLTPDQNPTDLCGCIIGVEPRSVPDRNNVATTRFYLTVMDDDGQMRSVNMDSLCRVRFLDERLDRDVRRYLQTLYQQHRRDEKTLTIRPAGSGDRHLVVSYLTETPVWKATYRIILPEPESDETSEVDLQGWAIVDNVSEEDWTDVQLSLVSGLPISFVQNLYDPIFIRRPVISSKETAAIAPTAPEAGLAFDRKNARRLLAGRPRRSEGQKAIVLDEVASAPGAAGASPPALTVERMRQLQAQAATREIGELFEYHIDHPVTIARNRSALLPIVAAPVKGRSVGLYNEATRRRNPLAAVRLTNTTGLTLEGGPLTVFRGASYVGEGITETTKPDEQRYITYAVDLGVRVEAQHDSSRERVFRVVINRGTMRRFRYVLETKTYHLNNLDDQPKTIVIEHPVHPGWKLMDDTKPIEVTENYRRFEVHVPPLSQQTFVVREQHDRVSTIALSNITPDEILACFRQKYITADVRDQLNQIVRLKADIAALDQQIKTLQEQRRTAAADQERISNVRARLRDTAQEKQLVARYTAKLGALLTRIDDIDQDLDRTRTQLHRQQAALDQLIETLTQDLRL